MRRPRGGSRTRTFRIGGWFSGRGSRRDVEEDWLDAKSKAKVRQDDTTKANNTQKYARAKKAQRDDGKERKIRGEERGEHSACGSGGVKEKEKRARRFGRGGVWCEAKQSKAKKREIKLGRHRGLREARICLRSELSGCVDAWMHGFAGISGEGPAQEQPGHGRWREGRIASGRTA
jgi:hypothetical protein